jgi:hypothetical protein
VKPLVPLVSFCAILLCQAVALATPAAAIVDVTRNGAACDGVRNDSVSVQRLVDSGGGAPVYIPPGSTCIVSGIALPSHAHMVVDGTLKLAATTNTSVLILAAGATDILIEGHGTIDGNRQAQTADGSAGIATSTAQSNGTTTSNVIIRDLKITNVRNWPINLLAVSHVSLSHLKLTNSGNSAEFVNAVDCRADHLYVTGINDWGFAFYGGDSFCSITESFASENAAGGFVILNDTGSPSASHDIIIEGNVATRNKASGITVWNNGGAGPNTNITIAHNDLAYNNQGNGTGYGGIWLHGAKNINVSNNIIHHDGNGTSSSVGIMGYDSVMELQVNDNLIFDEGIGGELGVGISVAGIANSTFVANRIYDDQDRKTMAFAINGDGVINSLFFANALGPTLGPPLATHVGRNSIAINNLLR